MNNLICCISLCLLNYFAVFCENISKKENVIYQMMNSFAQRKYSDGLKVAGTGLAEEKEGEEKGKLKLLKMSFVIDKSLTIQSARKIGIETIDQFLSYVNNDKRLIPFLIVNPITERNIRITITGSNSVYKENQYIKSISAGEGYIRYYSDELMPPNYGLILKETYEEALRKTQEACP